VERLDQEDNQTNGNISFTVIAIPLWIALIAWLLFSFGATDGNPCNANLNSISKFYSFE
jgi:hypothetical protein